MRQKAAECVYVGNTSSSYIVIAVLDNVYIIIIHTSLSNN